MLYTFLRKNLLNYKNTLKDPEIAENTDIIVSNILREVAEDKNSYLHIFNKDDTSEYIDKIVVNLREIFKDSLILSYSLINLEGETIESGFNLYWGD